MKEFSYEITIEQTTQASNKKICDLQVLCEKYLFYDFEKNIYINVTIEMNLNLTYLEHETPSKHIMKTKISHCALEFQVQTGKGGGSSSNGSSSIGWYSARRAHGLGCVLERTKHRASRASAQ